MRARHGPGEAVGVSLVALALELVVLREAADRVAEVVAPDGDVRVVDRRRDDVLLAKRLERCGDECSCGVAELGSFGHADILRAALGRSTRVRPWLGDSDAAGVP